MNPSSLRILLQSWLGHLPELLLILVALVQIAMAQAGGLLAWKGGGFGMFAGLDGVEFREVRVLGAADRRVEIPSELYGQERRCKIYPSESCLRDLANALETLGPRPHTIEVFRTSFGGRPLRPSWERIAGLDLIDGPGR